MCGRVEKADRDALRELIADVIDEHGWKMPEVPSYFESGEGFPTHVLPVLRAADGGAELLGMRWGIRPAWSKRDLINARQETMAEKSTWSKAFRERRCVIPVAGFYEWRALQRRKKKLKCLIEHMDRSIMLLAGLWSEDSQHGSCCTVVTTEAGASVRVLHDRQPVILASAHLPRWLDPGITERGPLEDLLTPIDELAYWHVGPGGHVSREPTPLWSAPSE